MLASFTLGNTMWYKHAPPTSSLCTPVEQLQPFERGRIVGMREVGWTYRRIAAHVGHNVSVACRCFQQSLWNIPTSADQVLDGRVVGLREAGWTCRLIAVHVGDTW